MADAPVLRLRVGAAGRDREAVFPVPSGWRITTYPPAGASALTENRIRAVFAGGRGNMPISDAARGARNAVILVDDFRRPTPVETLCLHVLEQLEAAGVPRERVTIITGGGAHRTQRRRERTRLGRALDGIAAWLIHDAFSGDVHVVGVTSGGTPVLVNAVAAEADFSVAISTVYPHPFTAWGGGAKLVLPGISHRSSIHCHHGLMAGSSRAGAPERCPARRDLEEAAALFGLDVAVCAVVNAGKELCGLFVGEPTAAHRRAVALARRVYRTDVAGVAPDLVIANAYPIDGDPTQLSKSQWPGKFFGVPMVQVFDFTDPSPYHGLYHGRQQAFNAWRREHPWKQDAERLWTATQILYSPQVGRSFIPLNDAYHCEGDWSRLVAVLGQRLPKASVAVFPAASLQIPEVAAP